MSKDIWHNPPQTPDVFKSHPIIVVYEAGDQIEQMDSKEYSDLVGERYVNRWCYVDDLKDKINEIIEIINAIVVDVDGTKCVDGSKSPAENVQSDTETRSENVQPDAETRSENVQDEMPRCPFCGEELYYAQEIDGGFEILSCNCPHGIWLFGNDKMWYNLEKATTELDRTRKVLDKAKWWLNEIVESHRCTPISTAEMALKEITALEQKDK